MEKKKINLDKEKKVVGEFKEFISKGNIVDMAVGVIIGSAFGKIVTSLVNDIFMPLIGIIIGVMVLIAGIYYLVTEKEDAESKKIYTIVTVAGAIVLIGSIVTLLV